MKLFERVKKPVFDADEEALFLADYHADNIASARLIHVQVFIIFLAAGFLDRIMLGELATLMIFMRYSIFSPLLFIFVIFSFTRFFKTRMQLAFSLVIAVISFYISLFTFLNEGEVALVYFCGSLLVVFVGFVYVPMLFSYALIMSVFLFIMSSVGLWYNDTLSRELVQACELLLLASILIALSACYTKERNARLSFRYKSILKQQNISLSESNTLLQNLARNDGLTGIANRRAFDERYQQEWHRAERDKSSLSVLLLDVDFFKPYNDIYGHQQGDECLIQLAKCLSLQVRRASDFVARYGGEEFVILLPQTDLNQALVFAEKVRQEIADLQIPHKGSKVLPYVTLSVGVSTTLPSEDEDASMERLLRNADRALYQAKEKGRNRVCEINS